MLFLPALLVALVASTAAHVLPKSHAALRAIDPIFPIEIELRDFETNVAIGRPVGIVAGFDTTLYIVSESGQIFLTDIRTGKGTLLNPGGDDQRFTGLCLDSRGPGTLYATGGETGLLYAFNRRGELVQKYQITTSKQHGGTAFLANCIQTRYQLLITDAFNPHVYYLELKDEGPLRGFPAVPNTTTTYQGVRMEYAGDWEQVGNGLNAFGVEWGQKFNETAYVMNSATGELFTFGVKRNNIVPVMQKVEVGGNVNSFPGALFMLFDSTNENVLYISMPHLNAIAAVEVSRKDPNKAKFIRYLMNNLIQNPVAVGEFGDWIYPISGHFKRGRSRNGAYSIVQMPRHAQIVSSSDPDEEFTTFYDEKNETKAEVVPSSDVQEAVQNPPPRRGRKAPAVEKSPDNRPPNKPGTDYFTPTPEEDGDTKATDPPSPTDPTRAPPSSGSTPTVSESSAPAPTQPPPTSEDESPAEERPDTIFGSASLQPDQEERACFPAAAPVLLESGLTVPMSSVKIGDRVLSGWDEHGVALFADVYMFSHMDKAIVSSFVLVEVSNGSNLEISPGHYMYINGRLGTANSVCMGDVVGTRNGEIQRVKSVRRVRRKGLYNPQTMSGDIVVAGVKVSTYTSALEPVIASALMSPLRAVHWMYRDLSVVISRMLAYGSHRIPECLPRGRPVYL